FVVEPWLTAGEQVNAWSWCFAAFALVCAFVAWLTPRATANAVSEEAQPVAARDFVRWLGLSTTGSVMLLAVTNHLTQNVASVPFLWVVPLALYLVTFILAFDHPRWYSRALFIALLLGLLPAMAYYVQSLGHKVAAPIY